MSMSEYHIDGYHFFGVCEKFQYVGWRNFVLDVIHKATYGFEKEKVNRQKISDLQSYDREADLIVPILIGKTV